MESQSAAPSRKRSRRARRCAPAVLLLAVALLAIAPGAALAKKKGPVVASIVTMTGRWNLNYTYTDTWQEYRTDPCAGWASFSESSNFHLNYKVAWKHVRIPMHEKDQGVVYRAQPVVKANSWSYDGNYPGCGDQPASKWACKGTTELAHSFLQVAGLGAESSKPKTHVARVYASDLYIKGFSPATCEATNGESKDPFQVVTFWDPNHDSLRFDTNAAGLNGQLTRRRALNGTQGTVDWYDGKYFLRNCSLPSQGGFRKDKCKQTLADPNYHFSIHVEKIVRKET